METKKSNRADLENKKMIFLQLGLIVSLGLALAAFEWKSPDQVKIDLEGGQVILMDQDITAIQTVHPTPPAPLMPKPATMFNLVDNKAVVEDFTPPDFGDNPEDIAPTYTPVAKPVLPDEKPDGTTDIFISAEKMPEFPGGEKEMLRFIADHISYPPAARETGTQGTVYVSFVVEKDGSVSKVKVLRGIGCGCDEEAMRVISLMPRWSPGLQRTMPVRVSFNMPIVFKLKDS